MIIYQVNLNNQNQLLFPEFGGQLAHQRVEQDGERGHEHKVNGGNAFIQLEQRGDKVQHRALEHGDPQEVHDVGGHKDTEILVIPTHTYLTIEYRTF